MSRSILFVAPHPDDETLGCGGTILRHIEDGDSVHWLIVTRLDSEGGFSESEIKRQKRVIGEVSKAYAFVGTKQLSFIATRLDTYPVAEIVSAIGDCVHDWQPQVVYLPFPGDAHTDHRVTFEAASSCTKWFRHSCVTSVRCYEVVSETEFGLRPDTTGFQPNLFLGIGEQLDRKLEILRMFDSELGDHPFPRSVENIAALARFRGAQCGRDAAEAFVLLRQVI